MNLSNNLLDLNAEGENLQNHVENDSESKKRKAMAISQENQYQDMNSQLRELYFLRRQKDIEMESQSRSEEKVLINLNDVTSKHSAQENISQKITQPKSNPFEEMKENIVSQKKDGNIITDLAISKGGPVMWINKLRIYPPDCILDHMITFRQLMYEDLLKNSIFNCSIALSFIRSKKSRENSSSCLHDNFWIFQRTY